MALPVTPVVRPAVLAGQTNGRLGAGILVDTPGQAGGYTVRLVGPAARAWRAMTAAAAAAGHVFKPSGPLDSYRPYDAQEREFLARFQTSPTSTGVTRSWQGRTWWLKPGVALAAVPGTSNHGWGLAVDIGEERDGDPGPESIDQGSVAWLVAHAHTFGWSAEVQSEPWHWRYFAGDRIPQAVLDFEAGHPFGGIDMLNPVKRGDRGDDVVRLMQALSEIGYQLPDSTKADGTFDGIYGPELAGAVQDLAGGDGATFGVRQWVALVRRAAGGGGLVEHTHDLTITGAVGAARR